MSKDHLAGICGLYCGACYIYLTYKYGDEKAVARLAEQLGIKPEELECQGCGPESEKCIRKDCKVRSCAIERGVRFCYQCDDYPCKQFKESIEKFPHLSVIREEQDNLACNGPAKWLEWQVHRWKCQGCGTKLGWYDVVCPTCKAKTLIPYLEGMPRDEPTGLKQWLKQRMKGQQLR